MKVSVYSVGAAPTDEWMKTVWCIYIHIHTHTMEYCLVIRKEIMPFAATQVDLESLPLSEVTQKDKHHMISLICRI